MPWLADIYGRPAFPEGRGVETERGCGEGLGEKEQTREDCDRDGKIINSKIIFLRYFLLLSQFSYLNL